MNTVGEPLNPPWPATKESGIAICLCFILAVSRTFLVVRQQYPLVFGALAEFERDLIRERTKAGLAAARARGRMGGRPKASSLNTAKKVALAQALYEDKNNSIADICSTLPVSRSTLYRYLGVGVRGRDK